MRLVFMEICRKEIPLRHPSLFCFFFCFFFPAFFTHLILFPGGPSLPVPLYEYYVLRTEGNAPKGAPYNFANSVIPTLTTKSPKIINHNQSSHH